MNGKQFSKFPIKLTPRLTDLLRTGTHRFPKSTGFPMCYFN